MERTIMISKRICEEVANDVVLKITQINEKDDEEFEKYKDYEIKPIKILINSPGGYVESGWAIVDAIQNSSTPVITIGTGQVASMALAILVAGHERYATKHTQFMYHEIIGGVWGNPKDIKVEYEHCEKLQEMYDQLIKENTNFPVEEIKPKNIDYWFDAEEALKYGVINKILERKQRN